MFFVLGALTALWVGYVMLQLHDLRTVASNHERGLVEISNFLNAQIKGAQSAQKEEQHGKTGTDSR